MADRPGLVLRYQPRGLRGRGGTYKGYGLDFKNSTGFRFYEELGSSKAKFAEENLKLARQVQEDVVGALKQGIKRRSVSSGRLAKVTADPGNIFASNDGQTWGVGEFNFLSNSEAKYWRTIDEGSLGVWKKPFAGRFYYVVRNRAWGRSATHGAERSFAGPEFEKAGASYGGKFNPLRTYYARQAITENGGKLPRWMGRMYITKEIAPEDYYSRGFARSGGVVKALRVYGNLIDRAWRGY